MGIGGQDCPPVSSEDRKFDQSPEKMSLWESLKSGPPGVLPGPENRKAARREIANIEGDIGKISILGTKCKLLSACLY